MYAFFIWNVYECIYYNADYVSLYTAQMYPLTFYAVTHFIYRVKLIALDCLFK